MANLRAKPVPLLIRKSLLDLGGRIATARKARALTQIDLAQLADVGLSTVSSLEGGHDGVSIGNLFKVLKALRLLGQADQLLAPELDPDVVQFAVKKLKGR